MSRSLIIEWILFIFTIARPCSAIDPSFSKIRPLHFHQFYILERLSTNREECRTVKIVVRSFGAIEDRFAREVLEIMNDCYNRTNAHAVEIVDIYLFDKSSSMNAFLSEEKRSLGVRTSSFEASFFAVHDAWRGTPRIMLAHDKMLALPRLISTGSLHHEAAHTVLHGSLEYYLFSVPSSLLETKSFVSKQIMRDLLYLVSLAVKDYEVTRLLYEKGFVEDQVAYNRYFLEPSEEDYEAWNVAKQDETARLLVLVSLLKTVFCAAILLKDEKYGREISESTTKCLSYLPTEISARVLRIREISSKFGENTHDNVDLLMRKLFDELIL